MNDTNFEHTVDQLVISSKINGAYSITSEINRILIHNLPLRQLRKVYPKVLEAELKYEEQLNKEYQVSKIEELFSEED